MEKLEPQEPIEEVEAEDKSNKDDEEDDKKTVIIDGDGIITVDGEVINQDPQSATHN